MKKLFKIIAAVVIAVVSLSVTTLAAGHEHDWEIFGQGNGTCQIICEGCSTMVSVDTDTPMCNHEFMVEGKANALCISYCTKCNYSVQQPHQWDIYATPTGHGKMCTICFVCTAEEEHTFVDEGLDENGHHLICTECGYEETHKVTVDIDETGHHVYCNECEWVSLHSSHKFSLTEWDENFHAQACECGYLVLESHNDCDCVSGNEDVESYTTIYGLVTNTFYDVVELNNNIRYNSIVEIECEIYDYIEITLNEYHEVVDLRVLVEREVIAANTVADIISDDEPLILVMEDGRALHFSNYEVYSYDDLKLQDGNFICIGENLVIFENEEKSIIIDIWGYDFDLDNDDENEVIGYGIITDSFINYDEYGNRYVIAEILVDGEYIEYELDNSLDRWDYNEGSFIEFTMENGIIDDIEVLVDADIVDDEENFGDYASEKVLDSYSMIEDLNFDDLVMDEIEFFDDELFIEFESERIDWTVEFDFIVYDLRECEMGELCEGDAILSFVEDEVMYIIIFW